MCDEYVSRAWRGTDEPGETQAAIGARQKLLALGAEEIEHRLRRRQQHLVLAGQRRTIAGSRGCLSTSRVVNRRSSSSVATVCADMKAMPRPAITACLDGLVAAHGEADLRTNAGGSRTAAPSDRAYRTRASRVRNVSPARLARAAMREFFAPGDVPSAAMMTWGVITDQVDVHLDVCRRAAHDRKVEIVARAMPVPISCRFPIESVTSTSGMPL